MKDKTTLSILQYNVRNERVTTMISLLADSRLQDYDIIAIQEPWKNPFGATTLSSHQSGFHLLYKPEGDTRVCFYINESIDPDSWEIEYPSADFCTLKIKIHNGNLNGQIYIHNVYNPSPTSYSSTESLSTLLEIERALSANADAEHVLLGNFNLHHPYWSGPSQLTQHAAADQLLDIVGTMNMELTLPPGTITWEARQSSSTIDLVFLSAGLVSKLKHCMTRPEMGQSSDHIPVSTKLLLQCEATVVPRRRAWKIIDMEKLKELLKSVPISTQPQTIADIDLAVENIQRFLCEIVNKTVPWAKSSDWAKPFWNTTCNTAVEKTQQLRKIWSNTRSLEDWQAYMRANDKKQKIIDKAKRLHYRQTISEAAASSTGLWRLAKWGKTKSLMPREIPKMPVLKTAQLEGQDSITAVTFEEKIAMLKNSFFPPPPQADLSDLDGYVYPPASECPIVITEKEVL